MPEQWAGGTGLEQEVIVRRAYSGWILVFVLAACSAGTGPALPTEGGAGPTASLPSPPASTLPPSRSVAPASPILVVPSTGGPPTDALPMPPDTLLSAAGEDHRGWRGSFCYGGMCGDAPYPDAANLDGVELAAASQELGLALADGSPFWWDASVSAAADQTGEDAIPVGGIDDPDEPVVHATFDGPDSGSWVLHVAITFDEEQGAAHYYWRLEVA
jgi:hypothetical protein